MLPAVPWLDALVPAFFNTVAGMVAGALALALASGVAKLASGLRR
jgi:hypothetical protein